MKQTYLDNAATSYPKPKSVVKALNDCLVKAGGNPGRGAHMLSQEAQKRIFNCREDICTLFGTDSPENVVFTYNATYALNMAIKGMVNEGEHIVYSNAEHNSVLRPVYKLCSQNHKNITSDVFNALCDDETLLWNFEKAITPKTSVAVVTVASNVCGKVLPVKEISQICKNHGVKLILDASQGAGCVPINQTELSADAICCAGHKSLYGIQGVGFCLFKDNANLDTLVEGGSGVASLSPQMADFLPERLEAGTCATPAICALCAGIKHVKEIGIDYVYQHGLYLSDYLVSRLCDISGVEVYGVCNNRTACVSFNKGVVGSERMSEILSKQGICVRGGLHCAPLCHKAFGTDSGGAVRVSMSVNTTLKELDRLLMCVSNVNE